ncbi:MAG: hypothetical protein K2I49_03045, partial [Ureaplasma sp.]|nr:hypothetical protein [Ureaplasma sp.]
MNKKAKKILITALSLTSLSSVIAIPLAVVNLNNKSNFSSSNVSTFNDGLISANQVDKQKTYRYFLDNNLKGKSYLSYDEAFNAYIREYDPIKYNLYMGNPYEAISNSNDNSI